ncbi:hypothetical protein [Devosia soli]|uniref:hypothetical protein n=1 Tax=Devosia soli TaxID=361041 RepID=UPI000A46512B|nr:hypothetical protein [Devosia soli]
MQREVNEFIVIAPAGLGKAVEWAEARLLTYLGDEFPGYRFRIEPFGPFADDDEFTVIPIMNRPAEPGEASHDDMMIMCNLKPETVPRIQQALRTFDPDKTRSH